MANNPNVNKVVYGNQTVMDITDTTAEPETVLEGEVFYDKSGTRQTGSAVIPDISNCYQTTDTAETAIADNDYFPIYDTSASAKKKSLWSNIKAKLNEIFFTRSEQGILGAKNFLKYPYSSTTFTNNNVTFTDNGDGTITVTTGQGGSSSETPFILMNASNGAIRLNKGTYVVSQPADYSQLQLFIRVYNVTTGTMVRIVDYNTSPIFTLTDDNQLIYANLILRGNQTVSNLKVSPMIRLASDSDDTWQPYAMTNRELTGKVGTLAPLASPAFTGTPTAPTAASGTNTTQIATTAFVKTAIDGHKYPYLLIREGVTASADSDVRIPASGYDSKIYPGLQIVYIPVAYSDTPIKFSQVKVHSGYLNITMAQAVTNIDMGVMIIT